MTNKEHVHLKLIADISTFMSCNASVVALRESQGIV